VIFAKLRERCGGEEGNERQSVVAAGGDGDGGGATA